MKRIVALVSLLLCIALAFGSCSLLNMSFRSFYRGYEFETAHEFTTSNKLSEIDELVYQTSRHHLIALTTSDSKTTKFYNVETETVVLSLTNENVQNHSIFSVFGIPFIFVLEKETVSGETTYTAVIYDDEGTEIAKEEDVSSSATKPEAKADLFKFNNTIFRVEEDGTVTTLNDNPITSYLPEIDTKSKKFYYNINSESVSVYNHDLECVFFWEVPFDNFEDSDIFFIANGVLIAQVFEALPDDAEDYDYLVSGKKMNVITYVLNAKRGSAKEIDANYIIDYVDSYEEIYKHNQDTENNPPKRVSNYSSIYYINDHRIDTNETEVTIMDNGNVFELAPGFDQVPWPVAEDRFIYYRDNGEYYLINARGKIIANLSGVTSPQSNEKFIIVDDQIYDYNLELVYDAKSDDKECLATLDTGVILRDADSSDPTYYLYTAEGEKKEIDNYSEERDSYYVTHDSEAGEFKFYNNNGELLLTVKGTSWSSIYTSNDGDVTIIKVVDSESKAHYYKFT